MARILVTGGSGFIGAGIVKHLAARGDEVIAFDMARTLRPRSGARRAPEL
jgi:nucleoside-diphosphate-sugar epimerase